jgi:quercetin dioxygenase-like cupin family protein
MAVNVRDVPKELSKLTMMMGRRPDSPHEDSEGHFAGLGSFNGAAIAVGSFQGGGCWERHTKGEELVQVLDGEADLVFMGDKGPERVKLTKGQFAVVPPGVWHRFEAPKGLTLFAATPQPTDHFYGDDPRKQAKA